MNNSPDYADTVKELIHYYRIKKMTSDEVLQDLIYYCPNEKCLDVTIIYSLPKQLIEPLLAWSKFVLGMDTPLHTFSGDMRTGDEMQNAVVQ